MFDRQSIHVALLLWGVIFCLIAFVCMFMSQNFDREKRRWLLFILMTSALLLLSDALAWVYRGGTGIDAVILTRSSNFGVFIFSDILLSFFHGYVCCYLFPDSRKRIHLAKKSQYNILKDKSSVPEKRMFTVYLLAGLGCVMVIVSQFTNLYYYIDAQNYYHRAYGYILALLIPSCGMILDLSIIIQYRKKLRKEMFAAMLSYIILPFTATIILMFYYGISFVNIAVSISVVFMFVTAMIEQNQNLAKKEQEAADMRISIMVSQIQPHFLYNSLNTIYHLCDKDVELAKEAISNFSEYLKHVLRSVKRNTPVPFSEELEYVKTYLELEKMRFDEDLNIRYNIETVEFLVPALSIQPLVENAVKHGICKKEEGGTLTLSTRKKENCFEVEIADDGIGFDPEKIFQDGKLHVGIQNVKQRLYVMCRATLEIDSKPGKGTTVIVQIPENYRLK